MNTRPVVEAARSRHRAAVDRIDSARSGFLPQVDITAGGGYEVTNNTSTRAQIEGGSEDLGRYDATIVGSQLLFDNGGTRSRTEAARFFAESEQHGILSAEEQLSFDVTQVYLAVILSEQLLRRANDNYAALNRISRLVDALVRSGRAREADAIQARARIAAAREEIARRQRDLDERRAQFLEVVGQNPRSLKQPRLGRGQLPGSVEQALNLAQRVNPFLQSAISRERAAEAEARATEEPFLPRVTFDVTGTLGENLGGVRGVDNSASAQLRLRFPLYTGGRDTADRRRAVELAGVAQQERGEIAREVREAIRRAFARLKGDRARVPPLVEQASDTAKVVDAYLAQFELGRRSLFDLLDAQSDLYRSQVALDEVRILALQDEFELLATVGNLRQSLSVAAR
ncbi:TolC family outer membrane protein [Stappia sp. F7233]|uniref:TolC family outer membrane protein n=1 Tax=Stappia albiluteola TaxID=2758565 RepID=A0A839ADS9_9HYPH|nr:TolC family outer membrane protein [Stappia albiluteola]